MTDHFHQQQPNYELNSSAVLLDEVKKCQLRLRQIDGSSLEGPLVRAVEDAIDDSVVTSQILINFNRLESELCRLRLYEETLSNENRWLREELKRVRQQLTDSECGKTALEIKVEDLKFRMSMMKNDQDSAADVTLVPSPNGNDLEQSLNDSLKSDDFARSSTAANLELPRKYKHIQGLILHYMSQNRGDIALLLAKQLVTDIEQQTGSNCNHEIVVILNLIAQITKDRGKYQESIQALKRALSIREKLCGPNDVSVASILNNLSVLYGKQGKYREAEVLCSRALKIREDSFGRVHPEVTRSRVSLGLIMSNLGKYAEAENCYRRAIDDFNELGKPDAAASVRVSLLGIFLRQNKAEEADKVFRELIDDSDQGNFKVLGVAGAKSTFSEYLKRNGFTKIAAKVAGLKNADEAICAEVMKEIRENLR